MCVSDVCQCPTSTPLWHNGTCIAQRDCPRDGELGKGAALTAQKLGLFVFMVSVVTDAISSPVYDQYRSCKMKDECL